MMTLKKVEENGIVETRQTCVQGTQEKVLILSQQNNQTDKCHWYTGISQKH